MQKLWLNFFCRVFAEFDIAYLSVSVKQISSCMKFVFLFFALKPVGKFNNTVGVDKPDRDKPARLIIRLLSGFTKRSSRT